MQKGAKASDTLKLMVESSKRAFVPGKLVSSSGANSDFSAPKVKRIAEALDDGSKSALARMTKRIDSVLRIPKKCSTAMGCDLRGKKFIELVGEGDSFHPTRNPLDALLEYTPVEKVRFMLRMTEGENGHYIGLVDGARNIAVLAFYGESESLWGLGMDNESLNASASLEASNRLAAIKALHKISVLLEDYIRLALKHATNESMARVCGAGSLTLEKGGKIERVFLEPGEFFKTPKDFCTHIGIVGKNAALKRVGYLVGEAYARGCPGLNLDDVAYSKEKGFVRKGAPWSGDYSQNEKHEGELNPIKQAFLTFVQAVYVGEAERAAILEGWRQAFADAGKAPGNADEIFGKVFPKLEYKTESSGDANGLFG